MEDEAGEEHTNAEHGVKAETLKTEEEGGEDARRFPSSPRRGSSDPRDMGQTDGAQSTAKQ